MICDDEAKYMGDDGPDTLGPDDICPDCNGSGEGQYDGTTCPTCKGR
jgi:DnaJ-class molecular chaperone